MKIVIASEDISRHRLIASIFAGLAKRFLLAIKGIYRMGPGILLVDTIHAYVCARFLMVDLNELQDA